jgi:hypothetical protein
MEKNISPPLSTNKQPIAAILPRAEKSKDLAQQGAHVLLIPDAQNSLIDFGVPNGLFQEYEPLFFRHGIRNTIAAELEKYQRHLRSTYQNVPYNLKESPAHELAPQARPINEYVATKATIYLQRKIKACLAKQSFEEDFAQAVEKWGELLSQEQAEHILGIKSHTLNEVARKKSLTRVHLAATSRGFPKVFWLKTELENL